MAPAIDTTAGGPHAINPIRLRGREKGHPEKEGSEANSNPPFLKLHSSPAGGSNAINSQHPRRRLSVGGCREVGSGAWGVECKEKSKVAPTVATRGVTSATYDAHFRLDGISLNGRKGQKPIPLMSFVQSALLRRHPDSGIYPSCWWRQCDKLKTSPPEAFRWMRGGGEWGVRRRRGCRLSLL